MLFYLVIVIFLRPALGGKPHRDHTAGKNPNFAGSTLALESFSALHDD